MVSKAEPETQQRKHKYEQNTIQNTTIKSITVVDTWHWSNNKISHIITSVSELMCILSNFVSTTQYLN